MTKAIVLVYIFGTGYDPLPIARLAHERNLLFIEDSAQMFFDTKYLGCPEADFTFYSFGTIKKSSAIGGGITVIRRQEAAYQKMKTMHDKYPIASNYLYLRRFFFTSIGLVCLNSKWANPKGRLLLTKLGFDYKKNMITALRGFVPEDDFLATFRLQPPTPLLAMLYLRISTFNREFYKRVEEKCYDGQKALLEGKVDVPGSEASKEHRHFW